MPWHDARSCRRSRGRADVRASAAFGCHAFCVTADGRIRWSVRRLLLWLAVTIVAAFRGNIRIGLLACFPFALAAGYGLQLIASGNAWSIAAGAAILGAEAFVIVGGAVEYRRAWVSDAARTPGRHGRRE